MPTATDQTAQLQELYRSYYSQQSAPAPASSYNQPAGSAPTSSPAPSGINADGDRTQTTNQQGSRGSIVTGDVSAKTSMGGGGSGGGGGGGGGGGAGGYSLGASIATGPEITTSGIFGDVNNRQHMGDNNVNFGGMQANGTVLALVAVCVVAGFFAWKG